MVDRSRIGPIDECMLDAVRKSNHNKPIDVQTISTDPPPPPPTITLLSHSQPYLTSPPPLFHSGLLTKLGTPATIAEAMGLLKSRTFFSFLFYFM